MTQLVTHLQGIDAASMPTNPSGKKICTPADLLKLKTTNPTQFAEIQKALRELYHHFLGAAQIADSDAAMQTAFAKELRSRVEQVSTMHNTSTLVDSGGFDVRTSRLHMQYQISCDAISSPCTKGELLEHISTDADLHRWDVYKSVALLLGPSMRDIALDKHKSEFGQCIAIGNEWVFGRDYAKTTTTNQLDIYVFALFLYIKHVVEKCNQDQVIAVAQRIADACEKAAYVHPELAEMVEMFNKEKSKDNATYLCEVFRETSTLHSCHPHMPRQKNRNRFDKNIIEMTNRLNKI